MTTNEAIKILEDGDWWNWVSDDMPDEAHDIFHNALDFAISALREKQKMENQGMIIAQIKQRTRGIPLSDKTFTEPYCSACKRRIEDISAPYCAYCGRPLKGESNGTTDI